MRVSAELGLRDADPGEREGVTTTPEEEHHLKAWISRDLVQAVNLNPGPLSQAKITRPTQPDVSSCLWLPIRQHPESTSRANKVLDALRFSRDPCIRTRIQLIRLGSIMLQHERRCRACEQTAEGPTRYTVTRHSA